MKTKISAIILGAFVWLLTASPMYALSVSDVEGDLMCQCGCTMVMDVCQCGTAEQMRAQIQGFIDQGWDKGQILDYYVAQYGETALSAPVKKGFNLTVWVVPFAALAGGGTLLYFLLRAWVRRGRVQAVAAGPVADTQDVDEEYRARLEEELRRFKAEGTL
jgi:cytochrome c-type biogenesis protein CcmH